jgi:hypothetical protein
LKYLKQCFGDWTSPLSRLLTWGWRQSPNGTMNNVQKANNYIDNTVLCFGSVLTYFDLITNRHLMEC